MNENFAIKLFEGKKMLRRDPELKSKWGTICPPVEMLAPHDLSFGNNNITI